MLLIKRICQTLQKPVFEVMRWPLSELEYWATFFHIDDTNAKPIVDRNSVTVKQSIKQLKGVLN